MLAMVGALCCGLSIFLIVQAMKNESLMLLNFLGVWWGVKRRVNKRPASSIDLHSAEARKGKKVSYFIKKFWTAFEEGIRKNTQM